jgi:ADP-ribosylglycohydrolase
MSSVLLGGAIGDALGMPFESKPANNSFLLSWDQKSFLPSEHHRLKAGSFTDDSQFSQTVARSLIDNNDFNPDDLSKRYVELFTSNIIRGYGRTTLLAINNLIAGKHWSQSGVAGSFGNGTAMRAAPFGIYFRNDLSTLIKVATIDAQITHASDEAIAGSIAIALAAACAVNNDTDKLLERIYPYLPDSKVKSTIYILSSLLDAPNISPAFALAFLGTKADVRETVPCALYLFMKYDNYPQAVLAAINAGNDTDTTASIVGSLFGAKYGMRDIPSYWTDQVEDRDKLIILDSQLYNRSNNSYMKVQ